jgi:hypothetical protein
MRANLAPELPNRSRIAPQLDQLALEPADLFDGLFHGPAELSPLRSGERDCTRSLGTPDVEPQTLTAQLRPDIDMPRWRGGDPLFNCQKALMRVCQSSQPAGHLMTRVLSGGRVGYPAQPDELIDADATFAHIVI